MIAIDAERIHLRVGVLRRVPAIDPEALDVRGRLRKRPVLTFADPLSLPGAKIRTLNLLLLNAVIASEAISMGSE